IRTSRRRGAVRDGSSRTHSAGSCAPPLPRWRVRDGARAREEPFRVQSSSLLLLCFVVGYLIAGALVGDLVEHRRQHRRVERLRKETSSALRRLGDELLVRERRDQDYVLRRAVAVELRDELGAENERHPYVTDDRIVRLPKAPLVADEPIAHPVG